MNGMVHAVPTFFIKYEDLKTDPQTTLEKVFAFLLNVESVEGLNVQKRIKEVVGMGPEASLIYAQKVESNNQSTNEKKPIVFNRNIHQFTIEQ